MKRGARRWAPRYVSESSTRLTLVALRMSASLKSLGIEKLSVEERLSLVEELWDSIAEATPLTDAQRAELDRRLEEHKSNPNDVVPWEAVKASITARLKR